jgi:hypothetical protein
MIDKPNLAVWVAALVFCTAFWACLVALIL